jgi:hypothetical protein
MACTGTDLRDKKSDTERTSEEKPSVFAEQRKSLFFTIMAAKNTNAEFLANSHIVLSHP